MKRMSQKRGMEEEPVQQRKKARLGHDWRTPTEEKLGTDNLIDPERNLDELLNLLEDGDNENDNERGEGLDTENKRNNPNPGPEISPGMTKKAANVKKLEVRERVHDDTVEEREHNKDTPGPENGPGKTKKQPPRRNWM